MILTILHTLGPRDYRPGALFNACFNALYGGNFIFSTLSGFGLFPVSFAWLVFAWLAPPISRDDGATVR